jgi:hypothetical protein
MSATYKLKITRPDLSTPFYTQDSPIGESTFANDSSLLSRHVGLIVEESTLSTPEKDLIPKYEEAITWNEVWERRNDLQPSEKTLLEATWNDGDNGYTEKSQYADYNPFTVTFTSILVFDTLENLLTSYNGILTDVTVTEIVNQATNANNVITEEIFVDGNLDTSVTLKFAGRF